ncbi:MAG: hypothetical protein WD341_01025 [Tistlia sp.]|uniref:hypothetical protein n=1 Tax=Tistlia sp. TaxID=3057121 RepID=UPI0034A2DDE7
MNKTIIDLVNQRLTRVLLAAEAALPPDQFRAFRKFALDEFGQSGLAEDLRQLRR